MNYNEDKMKNDYEFLTIFFKCIKNNTRLVKVVEKTLWY